MANGEIEADEDHVPDKPLVALGRTVGNDKHAWLLQEIGCIPALPLGLLVSWSLGPPCDLLVHTKEFARTHVAQEADGHSSIMA
jgi:hypothetical protein